RSIDALFSFVTTRPTPRSTLFPYTTLFRSRSESFLAFIEACRRQPNSDIEAHHGQNCNAKADVDGAPGGFKAVAFGQHVADDISQREYERRAVCDHRSKFNTLGGVEVGNKEDDDKHRGQPRIQSGLSRVESDAHAAIFCGCGCRFTCHEIHLRT